MGVNYVKNTFGFYGVKNIEIVILAGHHQFPDQAEEIITRRRKQKTVESKINYYNIF
jgi:FMN-dependent NADH-azoreductase